MEIPPVDLNCRTYNITKKRTLKNGTVKEYKYEKKYNAKTDHQCMGKNELIKRLHNCKDKDSVEQIRQLFDELGL